MDLPSLVEKLNAPPFDLDESVVTLSDKVQGKAHDAGVHQLLTDVFARVSPDTHPRVDVETETPEETVARISDFLRHIKYKTDEDELSFREGIANGDSDTILPILRHLVQKPEQIRKRAFVGFYLSDVPLPDDIANDEDVMQIRETIRMLQQEFVRLHRASEQAKGAAKDPMKLRQRIPELENEKGQLKDKIDKTKAKLAGVSGLEKMLKQSADLRREQDTEKQLASSLQQQRQHLHMAETRYQRLAGRMRELQTTAANGSSAAFLSQLEEETASCRVTAREKLPKELEAKRARLESIKEVIGSSLNSEADLQTLLSLRERMQGEVTGLVDRRNQLKAQLGERIGLQLRQQMQMANVIAKKREDTLARYDRLSLKRADLSARLAKECNDNGGDADVDLHGEDVQRKMASVKQKLAAYKSQKRQLEEQRAELLELQHGVDVLTDEAEAAKSRLSQAEAVDGVSGAASTMADLERVSVAKSEIDQVKGEALEEISKVVVQITSTIKARKEELAPKIKELRTLRQMSQSVEDEHKARQQEYQRALLSYKSRRARLDEEVATYVADITRDESRWHLLNCNAGITDISVHRCTQANESKRLQQRYEAAVAAEEERSRELRAQHRDIKGTSEPNKMYASALEDIKELLKCKLDLYKSGGMNDSAQVTTRMTTGGADVMTFG